MDGGPVEVYLASIWMYHEAGAQHVLNALSEQHPDGQYTFEEDAGWFKVTCQAEDVLKVQTIFRAVHKEMERDLDPKKVPVDHRWFKTPSPGGLPKKPVGDSVVDQMCPVTFDQLPVRRVWTRVKTDTPENIQMHNILSEDDRKSIMARTGAHLTIDSTGRLVYIGAETKVAVANASTMIDNLFARHVYVMPSPKHLMYAETDSAYHVDTRYMAHVNDRILTSTILDPSQFSSQALLEAMLKSVFRKSVCLRICEVDHVRRIEVSLFGPRAEPIFNDQARKWPKWFRRAEYTSKAIGLPAPKKDEEIPPGQEPIAQPKQETKAQGDELVCLSKDKETNRGNKCQEIVKPSPSEQVDLLGLDLSDASDTKAAPDAPATSNARAVTSAPKTLPPAPTAPDAPLTVNKALPALLPPMPASYQSEKHSYQMKLLWDFMNSPLKISSNQAGAKPAKLIEAKPEAKRIESAPVAKLIEGAPMETKRTDNDLSVKDPIDPKTPDGQVKQETDMAQLIDFFDDAPTSAPSPAPTPAPAPAKGGSNLPPTPENPVPAPKQNETLIEIDDAPCPRPSSPSVLPEKQTVFPNPQSRVKARSAAPSGSDRMSKALVRRSTFASSLCHGIGRLMADLPYSRGRIRLQVELGRVYIMDANPDGLAFNLPGEAAAGWPPTELTTRLDTICVSPESVIFTRALTLFANDMESVLGLNANAPLQSLLTNGGGSILDGNSSDSPLNSLPEWAFHEKRIVYEFKCQRVYLKGNGTYEATSPFVIEVDGTEPDAFTYAIRSVEDTRPPIWIHCIRRHWDARISVSYSQTDKLEAEYGDFARELLRSLVVPAGPITTPAFHFDYDHREVKKDGKSFSTMVLSARLRNIGRFMSADQQSYLDVSWNWLMALSKRAGKDGPASGTMHAKPTLDNPGRGQFASWYEASVVSAEAEAAFRENETLPAGGVAAWGSVGTAALDEMFESAFGPALRLVKKMDGVGVLVDNGQAEGLWTPATKASKMAKAVQKFW